MATLPRPRRQYLLFTLVPVTGMVIAAACGFPNPAIEGEEGGTSSIDGGDGPLSETGGNDLDGGPTEAQVPLDARIERDEASAKVEDAAACATTCDCDKDGYNRASCDAGPDVIDAGPIDCDDLDPLRNPGIIAFSGIKPEGHAGDWNCNGDVEKGYAETVKCGGTVLTGCTGGPAFTEPVPCGVAGNWYRCESDGLACVPTKFEKVETQVCR